MLRVGITGGIGSGKSTVSRVFESLGVPVYYTDPRAKALMAREGQVADELIGLLGPQTYLDGELDRAYVASRIFSDRDLIRQVNDIVHPRVAEDFERWVTEMETTGAPYVIMECAILFESGFSDQVNYTVTVSAPVEERLRRAVSRDSSHAKDIKERMEHQMDDHERESLADFTIENSDHDMILPEVLKLHKFFTDESRR